LKREINEEEKGIEEKEEFEIEECDEEFFEDDRGLFSSVSKDEIDFDERDFVKFDSPWFFRFYGIKI